MVAPFPWIVTPETTSISPAPQSSSTYVAPVCNTTTSPAAAWVSSTSRNESVSPSPSVASTGPNVSAPATPEPITSTPVNAHAPINTALNTNALRRRHLRIVHLPLLSDTPQGG